MGLFGSGQSEIIVLKVGGMGSQHCVGVVQNGLGNTVGVKSAKADLASGNVTIEFDPKKTDKEKLAAVIEDLGYDVLA